MISRPRILQASNMVLNEVGTGSGKNVRVDYLDFLRGVALLGILYAHFVIWHTGSALPSTHYRQFQDTGSMVAMAIFGTFVLSKFYSIFSFLFGASFFYAAKERPLQTNVTPKQITRFSVLIIFGFIHHIFWRGDIIMIYGLLGFVLLAVRNFNNLVLLILGALLVLNVPGLITNAVTGTQAVTLPMEANAAEHLGLMSGGSLQQFMRGNLAMLETKMHYQLESGRLFRTLGFFLIGFFAARHGWFQPGSAAKVLPSIFQITAVILMIFFTVGGVLFLLDIIQFNPLNNSFDSILPLGILFDVYNVTLTLFYISASFRFFRRIPGVIRGPLMATGKMAFSVYLMQTVVGLLIFYPFGLHWFIKTSPGVNALLVLPFFLIQAWCCQWWLNRFQCGPVEWVLRVLCKGREQAGPQPRLNPVPLAVPSEDETKKWGPR